MLTEYKAYRNQLKNPPTGNNKEKALKDRTFFKLFDELMSDDVRVVGIGNAETGMFISFTFLIYSFRLGIDWKHCCSFNSTKH